MTLLWMDCFETTDNDTLRVLVVMADRGSNDGFMLESRAGRLAEEKNIKIHTVGLSENNDDAKSFKATHTDLSLGTGGLFYYAPAGTLSEMDLNIGLNMDIFEDDDSDGLPNAYEENMYLFNGVKIITERDNSDTDGDGLYDYRARTGVKDGKEIVVAPMDTQPDECNGTKGLWDKHVEMYETTDIPTEYGDYEEEWED